MEPGDQWYLLKRKEEREMECDCGDPECTRQWPAAGQAGPVSMTVKSYEVDRDYGDEDEARFWKDGLSVMEREACGDVIGRTAKALQDWAREVTGLGITKSVGEYVTGYHDPLGQRKDCLNCSGWIPVENCPTCSADPRFAGMVAKRRDMPPLASAPPLKSGDWYLPPSTEHLEFKALMPVDEFSALAIKKLQEDVHDLRQEVMTLRGYLMRQSQSIGALTRDATELRSVVRAHRDLIEAARERIEDLETPLKGEPEPNRGLGKIWPWR